MTVNILGTEYTIEYLEYSEKEFGNLAGYCSTVKPYIAVCKMETHPDIEESATIEEVALLEKSILRHEIVHAFLHESGLLENTLSVHSWATNEEMVDWIAVQGAKIYRAWEEVNAL